VTKLKICVDCARYIPRDATGRVVMDAERMWMKARTVQPTLGLHVGFMDGDPRLQTKVLRIASEWSKHANVTFVHGEKAVKECTIRISFKEAGAWSMVGTDAKLIPREKATMNFGWLGLDSPELEIQRVVLHEFGHALGCVHEHFHPAGGIPWNAEKVYDWYEKNLGWDRQKVDDQVLCRYTETMTVHSGFDFDSIMLYPILPELTDGVFQSKQNVELSEMDKQFIAEMYPRP